MTNKSLQKNGTVRKKGTSHKSRTSYQKGGLINKMFVNEYPVPIVKIIQAYLHEKFNIKINSTTTRQYTVANGVLQSSVILQHLYIIMTHDMGTNGIQTALLADDTCMYKASNSAEIANRRLDIHVNTTLNLCLDKNKMKINANKSGSKTKNKEDNGKT